MSATNYLRQLKHDLKNAFFLALRSKALEILSTLAADKQEDYHTVISALEIRYGSLYLKQSQLRTKFQGNSESLQEFGHIITSKI